MNWKFIIVLMAAVGGWVGYYLWHKIPDVPKEATYDAYTKNVIAQEQKAKDVVSVDNVKDMQNAVERYRSEKSALPSSLQDLVPEFTDHVPGGLAYDPSTGVVSAAP